MLALDRDCHAEEQFTTLCSPSALFKIEAPRSFTQNHFLCSHEVCLSLRPRAGIALLDPVHTVYCSKKAPGASVVSAATYSGTWGTLGPCQRCKPWAAHLQPLGLEPHWWRCVHVLKAAARHWTIYQAGHFPICPESMPQA